MQNFQLDVRGCILSPLRTNALHLSTLIVEELKYNILLNSVICYEFCLSFDLYKIFDVKSFISYFRIVFFNSFVNN